MDGMTCHQGGQLSDDLLVQADLEFRGDPFLGHGEPQLVEAPGLAEQEGLADAAEGWTAPERQGRTKALARLFVAPLGSRAPPFGDERFERGTVDRPRGNVSQVARLMRHDDRWHARTLE